MSIGCVGRDLLCYSSISDVHKICVTFQARHIDYNNFTIGGSVNASLDLDKISFSAEFEINKHEIQNISKEISYIKVIKYGNCSVTKMMLT